MARSSHSHPHRDTAAPTGASPRRSPNDRDPACGGRAGTDGSWAMRKFQVWQMILANSKQSHSRHNQNWKTKATFDAVAPVLHSPEEEQSLVPANKKTFCGNSLEKHPN